jgi:hypothetical protein
LLAITNEQEAVNFMFNVVQDENERIKFSLYLSLFGV